MLYRIAISESLKHSSDHHEAGVHDPGIFKAIFMAGGPGSGKSTILEMLSLRSLGLKSVNIDTLFELLMVKSGVPLQMRDLSPEQESQNSLLRDLAWIKLNKQMSLYLVGRLGWVVDGTGRLYGETFKTHQELTELGYETSMIFIDTSLDVALDRNKARRRSLPDAQVEEFWNQTQSNVLRFRQLFGSDNFIRIDNTNYTDQESVNQVFKQLKKFVSRPVHNPIALEWIAGELSKKAR